MNQRKRSPRRFLGTVVAVVMAVGSAVMVTVPRAAATTGDIGHQDQSFTGVYNPPTSDKPQSKLWFNDGLWWATMFDTASTTWHIFRLDRSTETWQDTGTAVDNRAHSLSDALWDGTKLYIGSQWSSVSSDTSIKVSTSGRPARLYRYSYDSTSKTYTLDSGFPVAINDVSSESLTIDKDSTGTLWATWTQVSGSSTTGYTSAVYVNSTQGGDSVWGTPMVLPVSGSSVAPDDISAVVAFQRSKIGVMWSNHLDGTMYWAVHNDGDPTSSWRGSVAIRGTKQADDHINLKTLQADQAGRVFAAVKTSLDELSTSSPSDPQIRLLVFKPGTGSWSATTFGTLADCHTRPLVMLDEQNAQVHVFATAPSTSGCAYAGAPGTIYEKVAPIDNPVFPSGRGTPVIRDAASANMNNVTGTKQSVNSATGLVVLASNTSTDRYWHADLTVDSTSTATVPSASFTASATSGTAPLTVQLTDTSTNGPTAWQWDLGNGQSSSLQNPSVTYDTAGTYTVTLVASNSAGSSAPATKTITVTADTGGGSTGSTIARAGTSTATSTTADTGLTIPAPTGTAAGDVLVACLALNGSSVASATVPSGWASIAVVTGVTNPRVYGYYKVAGSAEPASYRWGFNASVTSGGGIARYTGASGLDVSASTAAGASASSGTVPGVSTVTAGAMLVGCMGINSGATTIAITAPADMTQAWDIGGKRNEFDDALQPVAGASGAKTWQFSSAREWGGWLSALRPQ